jgi:hypothetical protein
MCSACFEQLHAPPTTKLYCSPVHVVFVPAASLCEATHLIILTDCWMGEMFGRRCVFDLHLLTSFPCRVYD